MLTADGKDLTVVIRDCTALGPVHVGRGHKLDVAQFQNSRYNSEDFVDLLRCESQVLHGFLQNTKAKCLGVSSHLLLIVLSKEIFHNYIVLFTREHELLMGSRHNYDLYDCKIQTGCVYCILLRQVSNGNEGWLETCRISNWTKR